MRLLFSKKNLYCMLFLDSVLVAACFYLAYLLRFEFKIPVSYWNTFVMTLPFLVPMKVVTFAFFKLYSGMWRYASLIDMINIAKAVVTSSLFVILAVLMIHHFVGYPRSVFLLDMFLTFLAIGGVRVAIRLYFAERTGTSVFPAFRPNRRGGRRLLIIGAGDAGEKVLREIRDNPGLNFAPVGFLDDDPEKQRRTIHGVPVLGTLQDLDRLGQVFDEILIAIASGRSEDMRRIVEACEQTKKPYKTVPSIGELIDGRVSVKTIRDVTFEDLLGRQQVHLDSEQIKSYLHQKRIMITGAGGSIGSELVRQIGKFDPGRLALLDASELNLFRVEMECRQRFSHVPMSSLLVDIRQRDNVARIFDQFKPQVVFHAAAYKHVPLQELHPWEAVQNNIWGTRNLLEMTTQNGGERFVFVSTDKAVRPVSVMGATKRVAEMLLDTFNGGSGTQLMSVRFGNVIGSSGSAIPIFREQIARGGPVTVTHPEMTRYFMSISEAAQLILQAGAMGRGGEIFILKMGEPVRIVDMAKDLIRLCGFEPERDIAIQFTGLRPGEKLYEELITEGEGIVETGHEKILVLRGNNGDAEGLKRQVDELLNVARSRDAGRIKRKLQEIVPEYTPSDRRIKPKVQDESSRTGTS